MDFDFSPDQHALRDTVRGFLGAETPSSYVRSMIDDPRVGRIVGRDALDRFVGETAIWLDERIARTMRVATTTNEQRSVQESVVGLDLGDDDPWYLPIAVVLDQPGGALGGGERDWEGSLRASDSSAFQAGAMAT